jgi:hypothetical protein
MVESVWAIKGRQFDVLAHSAICSHCFYKFVFEPILCQGKPDPAIQFIYYRWIRSFNVQLLHHLKFFYEGIEHHDVLLAHLQQLIISTFQLHFIRRSFKLLFSFYYSRNQCMFPVFGLGFVCCGRLRNFVLFIFSHVGSRP